MLYCYTLKLLLPNIDRYLLAIFSQYGVHTRPRLFIVFIVGARRIISTGNFSITIGQR